MSDKISAVAIGTAIHEKLESELNWGGTKRDTDEILQEFANELTDEKLTIMALSYQQGLSNLWGMADIARHYCLMPLGKPYVVKTKKGPRRYRGQMVRRYFNETQVAELTVGMPGKIHQPTKLPELK